jgi:tetrahydromethanopterin S-methyltransferase subunit G
MDRVNKKDLEETKERLEDIEKAVISILKWV